MYKKKTADGQARADESLEGQSRSESSGKGAWSLNSENLEWQKHAVIEQGGIISGSGLTKFRQTLV
jgi:hypothetical protein